MSSRHPSLELHLRLAQQLWGLPPPNKESGPPAAGRDLLGNGRGAKGDGAQPSATPQPMQQKGKIKYVSPIRWVSNTFALRFGERVIEALLAAHPDALDD
jgi:hypothetical protein